MKFKTIEINIEKGFLQSNSSVVCKSGCCELLYSQALMCLDLKCNEVSTITRSKYYIITPGV